VFEFAYSGRPPQLYFIALSRRSTLRKEGHRGCGSSPEEVNYPSPSCTVDDHRSEPKILTLSIVLIQYCTSQHLRIYSSLLYNDRSKLGLPSAFWLSEILCISTRVDLLWRCIRPGFVIFEAILSQRRPSPPGQSLGNHTETIRLSGIFEIDVVVTFLWGLSSDIGVQPCKPWLIYTTRPVMVLRNHDM
jgi:hypothetical protein